jgi:hypothetical protein
MTLTCAVPTPAENSRSSSCPTERAVQSVTLNEALRIESWRCNRYIRWKKMSQPSSRNQVMEVYKLQVGVTCFRTLYQLLNLCGVK